jgi:acid phosphatase
MMSLGTQLRKLYVEELKFLNSNLKLSDIYVRSTDYSRTIESVQYLLSGIYPQKSRSNSDDITLHVKRGENETMYPHWNCASLMRDTKSLREKLHAQTMGQTNEIYDRLKHLGLKNLDSSNLNSVHRIYDFFACLEGHGISFPWRVEKTVLNDLENLAVKQWCSIYQDSSIAQRAIGRFLPEIYQKIHDSVHNSNDKVKLAIFSGHDSTISPLMVCIFDFTSFRVLSKFLMVNIQVLLQIFHLNFSRNLLFGLD